MTPLKLKRMEGKMGNEKEMVAFNNYFFTLF